MKILLVALNAKYIHSNLAVHNLQKYANKNGAYSDVLEIREYTINNNLEYIIQMLYHDKPDIVAFSCYIWNISEVLVISKELKKVMPELKVWLGGPEVSYDSESVLNKNDHIEGVILGEGEETFAELMEYFVSNDDDFKSVLGISYRDTDGNIITTSLRTLISMDDIPFIYNDFSDFKNRIIYYESSRGCPFSCSYCLSSIDKSVRFRDLKLVFDELKVFLDANVPQVKFIDRTFNCNRERAVKIWKFINDNDNGVTNFHFEISADLIGDEEIEVFSTMRPALIQLEIGLQSTNENTVREIRRTMNIEKVKSNMLKIRKLNNIHQHLDLIAGLPNEDYLSFQKSFCDAYSMKPNQLQLGFLKVLKGSYMEERKEDYGIICHDSPPYEVMSTKWISYDEIIKLKHVEEMVEVYYNSGQFDHVLDYLLSFFETPFSFFSELGEYYDRNRLFDIGFRRELRYEVLRDFAINKVDSEYTLDYLLSYDYYLRENAKKRPPWSKEEPIKKDIYQGFFIRGGNEEFSLINDENRNTYDSKVSSRIMHIEPISFDAYKIICKENTNDSQNDSDIVYCLFDYNDKNSLTKDAKVYFLSKL